MPSLADTIIADLRRIEAQRQLAEKMGTLKTVKNIQQWQCKRLLNTHHALTQDAEYKQAIAFFIDELYAPKDFSQRDADIARVVPKLSVLLPAQAMQALADAISLNALSFDMDLDLVHHLQGELNALSYAQAYRAMGRLSDRQHQIDAISHLASQLGDVVKIRGVTMLIKLARKPAKVAGLLSLHEFLERGFSAFKDIGDIKAFITPIISKEVEIMTTLHDPNIALDTHNPIPQVSL